MHTIDDMHRVQFAHEAIHDRLTNWSRWCNGSRGGADAAPMFKQYKAPRFRNASDEIRVPIDSQDAMQIEHAVCTLPEKHRDALRFFYVYSKRGMGLWQAVRGLQVRRDTLVTLIHDGRGMLRANLDMLTPPRATMAVQPESASAALASLTRCAGVGAAR
jgi:hypothetical protein